MKCDKSEKYHHYSVCVCVDLTESKRIKEKFFISFRYFFSVSSLPFTRNFITWMNQLFEFYFVCCNFWHWFSIVQKQKFCCFFSRFVWLFRVWFSEKKCCASCWKLSGKQEPYDDDDINLWKIHSNSLTNVVCFFVLFRFLWFENFSWNQKNDERKLSFSFSGKFSQL